MDLVVSAQPDQASWSLSDLLGRSMGVVREESPGEFTIVPEGQARETMQAMVHGPYRSLDDALAAIERHTRGVCRRAAD